MKKISPDQVAGWRKVSFLFARQSSRIAFDDGVSGGVDLIEDRNHLARAFERVQRECASRFDSTRDFDRWWAERAVKTDEHLARVAWDAGRASRP